MILFQDLLPRQVVALQDINVRIHQVSSSFGGSQWCGKSTFLKLLYREELPSERTLLIRGKDVPAYANRMYRRIGIISGFQLLPDRTVFENVAFACT